ncbi:MAG TPA: flagellar biosynthetic protein FliP [Porticoccaceae bacterium]|nr:flagellar biosynthetic protein FliP [Porticoccaceae bacterium]HCO58933.1 flagellar biosynthetic protein FliP [Porticoccaceae bacterium]
MTQSRWLIAILIMVAMPASAQQGVPLITVTPNADGSESYSLAIQILLLMTVLTLLPAALIAMTSFTRVLVVFAILRQALGTAQTPSNQILLGLALFTTVFIMTPVFERAYTEGINPYIEEQLGFRDAARQAILPFREFMLNQVRDADLSMFLEMSGQQDDIDTPADVPLKVLLPAFVVSELKTAFQIGFLIFIPFLIIDLVVASVLMSMGMMMLSPILISLPFKIMLFVLIDGWSLIVSTLVSGFYI